MEQALPGITALVAVIAATIFFQVRRNQTRKRIGEALVNGALILDVRTPGEFAGGHYEGAVNVPVDRLPGRITKIGAKDRTVVVYCASGARSARAASILKAAGFQVLNAGGLSQMP